MDFCRHRVLYLVLYLVILLTLLYIGLHNFLPIEYRPIRLVSLRLQADTTRQFIRSISTTRLSNESNISIWPLDYDETNDRIVNQLNYMSSVSASGNFNVSKMKIIFQSPHSNYGTPPPEGQNLFERQKCPIQTCSITRKWKDFKKANIVFIEGFETFSLKQMQPKPLGQVWVIFTGESPPLTSLNGLFDAHVLDGLVNWTMLYRRDATISAPYAKFQTFPNFTRIEDYPVAKEVNFAKGRTKKVAWFVSNCNYGVNSGRENYAKELSKYIDVDVYGRCGQLKCPKDDWEGCFQMLRKDYKFYLAFENNCCKDYITEKFFNNALLNDLVPVVLGAAPEDYKALAPPGSFIHVDDFESPKDLAKYLHLLDRNDTLYNEYFRWKRTGHFLKTSPWCRLCALLHANDDMRYVHWYPNFHKWLEEGVCLEKAADGQWQSWRKRKLT